MSANINHDFLNKYESNDIGKRRAPLIKKWWFLLIIILIAAIIMSGQAINLTSQKADQSYEKLMNLDHKDYIFAEKYAMKPVIHSPTRKLYEKERTPKPNPRKWIQIQPKEMPVPKVEPPKIVKPSVFLTFDDGPNQELDEILNILKAKQAKATFFMIEPQIPHYQAAVKRLVQEGHYPAIHSVTHNKTKLYGSPINMIDEMEKTRQTIREITGIDSTLIRAPYGSKPFMTEPFRNVLVQHQLKMWDWNIDTMDWKFQKSNPHQILVNTINGLERVENKKGPIVMLMHVTKGTASVLPQIIDYLYSKGYQFPAYDPSHHQMVNFWNDDRI